jgi:hypothetical protein
MTLMEVLALLEAVGGAVDAFTKVISAIHALGLKPTDPLPPQITAQVHAVLSALPDADDVAWSENHAPEGG